MTTVSTLSAIDGKEWMENEQPRRIDTAEAAKLIRAALKRAFPGVKFSVRLKRYSGGSSITVDWTDGPTKDQVQPITGQYQGADFDGMIDLKTFTYHWLLPDGSTMPARSDVGGQWGMQTYPRPAVRGAELVHFASDFVFCERGLSDEFTAQLTEILERNRHRDGSYGWKGRVLGQYLSEAIWRAAGEISLYCN